MLIARLKTLASCHCYPGLRSSGSLGMVTVVCRAVVASVVLVSAGLLAGCGATRPAPVADRLPPPKPAARVTSKSAAAVTAPRQRPDFHTVKNGETLYSIALEYGLDHRELALWNGVDPGRIRVGQQLRLNPPRNVVAKPLGQPAASVEGRPLGAGGKPIPSGNVLAEPKGIRAPYSEETYAEMSKSGSATPAEPAKPARAAAPGEPDWGWPVSGKVLQSFTETASKGIAIAGKSGQPVNAAADGRVIFSGTGIRGLGKLVVIKHNEQFLSVYAHNRQLLVKEGQAVSKGQKIAEMGDSDADRVKLHFEIRRQGKPVDPLSVLPPQ